MIRGLKSVKRLKGKNVFTVKLTLGKKSLILLFFMTEEKIDAMATWKTYGDIQWPDVGHLHMCYRSSYITCRRYELLYVLPASSGGIWWELVPLQLKLWNPIRDHEEWAGTACWLCSGLWKMVAHCCPLPPKTTYFEKEEERERIHGLPLSSDAHSEKFPWDWRVGTAKEPSIRIGQEALLEENKNKNENGDSFTSSKFVPGGYWAPHVYYLF